MRFRELTAGERSVRSFGKFLVDAHFRPKAFVFPLYFLALHVPFVGQTYKQWRILYALVLTIRSPEKTFNYSQEQSNEELRWVCCIYTALIMLVGLWCIHTISNGCMKDWYISYRREVRSCSFRL